MLNIRRHTWEDRCQCVVDGREDFSAAQHPGRPTLSHKYPIRRQLVHDNLAVEVLSVQLRTQ